jgi:hypothetical protein
MFEAILEIPNLHGIGLVSTHHRGFGKKKKMIPFFLSSVFFSDSSFESSAP